MSVQRINPPGVHQPTGYTHVVKVSGGDLLMISGQVALDVDGNLVGAGDLQAQATQAFENIKGILAHFQADFSNVVKINVYIVNYKAADRSALVAVRNRYINPENPPASTLIGVQSLALPELMIEIEAMAVVDSD
jgi:enamine deaminase RidA (YjgF/YER057c/UK114 family)